MSRRSRKRRRDRRGPRAGAAPAPTAPSAAQADDARGAAAPRRARGPEGPPAAPWGSFPLSELVVLIAAVLLVAGFFVSAPRGTAMVGVGLALGSLAGLELALREHLSGYRSHSLLLAGAVGVAVVGGLFALAPDALSPPLRVVAGALAFAGALYLFAAAFRRRSGGAAFRIRG